MSYLKAMFNAFVKYFERSEEGRALLASLKTSALDTDEEIAVSVGFSNWYRANASNEMSTRTINMLFRHRLGPNQLLQMSDREILLHRDIGEKTLTEINDWKSKNTA